jgi:hypothetical protein
MAGQDLRYVTSPKAFKGMFIGQRSSPLFSVNIGLIAAMDLGDEDDATAGPSTQLKYASLRMTVLYFQERQPGAARELRTYNGCEPQWYV